MNEQECAVFSLQFQKTILASLKRKGFLNDAQYGRCIEEIEKEISLCQPINMKP